MNTHTRKAACVAAAVATCWAVGQQARAQLQTGRPGTVTLNASTPVTDLYLLYGDNGSGGDNFFATIALPDAPTGQLVQQVTLVEQQFSTDTRFTVIGIYSDPNNPDPDERSGVSLTSNLFDVTPGVSEFSDVFSTDEATVFNALRNDDELTLVIFFQDNFSNFAGGGVFGTIADNTVATGPQFNFSTADLTGTASLAIPEPASLVLLAMGLPMLMKRRRGA